MAATKCRLQFTVPLVVIACLIAAPTVARDPRNPDCNPSRVEYQPVAGVDGSIRSVRSAVMNNLMVRWTEGFLEFYPNIKVEIDNKSAPEALLEGSAAFGPMVRSMSQFEVAQFESRYGYKPTQVPVAYDLIAAFVNKENPIKHMTLTQLDAVFSTTRKLGYSDDILTWGQLGLAGEWTNAPISLYGNSPSATYAFFKVRALGGGNFKSEVKEEPDSAAVTRAIAGDRFGIGFSGIGDSSIDYSGIGYATAGVKALALAKDGDSEPYSPTIPDAVMGTYPLARPLFLTINYKPDSQLEPLHREFIKYVFSKQGQESVLKDKYVPVSITAARKALEALGIRSEF